MPRDNGARRSIRPGRTNAKSDTLARKQIVSEAARIMAEEGVRDFQMAKRKAARRLNLEDNRDLPTNQEIEAATREYLALFHADLPQTLHRLRALAVETMQLLADFNPRLVGPVLSGTVTKFTPVQLHVGVEDVEGLLFFFAEHQIPVEQGERRVRLGGNRHASCPAFTFSFKDTPVELLAFRPSAFREPPLNPVDGKPMRRASIKEIEELIS